MGAVNKSEAGFTLVETLVSASILAIAAIAASYTYIAQKQASTGMSLQSESRQVMHDILNKIEQAPERFPFVVDQTGKSMSYVGCFDDLGNPRSSIRLSSGYYAESGMDPSTPFFGDPLPPSFVASVNQSYCQTKNPNGKWNGGIEVHVGRDNPGSGLMPNKLQIRAFILSSGSAPGRPSVSNGETRNYTAAASDISAEVFVAAPNTGGPNPGYQQPPQEYVGLRPQ